MAAKTIVILGGGVGGMVVANELRRLVQPEHHIVLIEKNRQHTFAPSFLWLMTGDRRPDQISRHVRQLGHKGVDLRQAEVRGIDLATRRVETTAGSLTYDFLVVAVRPGGHAGCDRRRFGIGHQELTASAVGRRPVKVKAC
jgi:sulfide:quinone oxidoreductase